MTSQAAPSLTAHSRRRPSRSFFWLGFVIGFTLLTLASCGGLVLSLGLNRLSLSDLTGSSSAWTPPTLLPTPELPAPAAPVTEGGAFVAGQTVRNVTGSRVNVRATPGHLGKPASDILLQISPGEQLVILGEAAQANNLTWQRVRVNGVEGWVAEATASGVQILGE